MYDFLSKGGMVMIPIIACSVVGLAVFLERMWNLQRSKIIPRGFIDRIEAFIGQGKISEAVVLCQENASAIAKVLAAGLKNSGARRSEIKEAVEEVGRHESAFLERYIGVLGTIAAISPLLGLLGTVTGMIKVFQKVTQEGVGDPRLLATGIWEALITTAVGLTVAIPAYVAYRYLLSRAENAILEMESHSMRMVDVLKGEERQ